MIPKPWDFEPKRLGDHIRKQRLLRGLYQEDAALQIGVTEATICNWENGHSEPVLEAIPGILKFLGYDPFPVLSTLSERMFAFRRARGWSIEAAARGLGVDPSTWGDWERTGYIPWRRYRELIGVWLSD